MSRRFLSIATVFLLLASGAAGAALLPRSVDSFRSNTSKAPKERSTQKGVRTVVSANNQFAFDLNSRLYATGAGTNVFFSPYSISAAVAMLYEGAEGRTRAELKAVLHFPERHILRPNFAAIFSSLNQPSPDYSLAIGNALWVQKRFPLLRTYIKSVKKYYAGKSTNLDFANDPGGSAKTINDYIAKHTANKITELIGPGLIDDMTRFVLTNAIYFKGFWEWPFDPANTSDREFTLSPGNVIKVPTMYMPKTVASFNYADTADLQILELPYKGDRISMLILLPHKDRDLNSIQSSLTADKLDEYRAAMHPVSPDSISIPLFEFKANYRLDQTLSDMGIKEAFSGKANFLRIDGRRDLYVTFVVHQAYIKVDEKGTEAAAATAGGGGITAVRPEIHFTADHPFLFIIQDNKTGNVLFLGEVNDPSRTD